MWLEAGWGGELDMAKFLEEYGLIMQIKTAELKNNLSKYLRRVRETGEPITICDRDKPVAVLSPLSPEAVECEEDREWLKERERILKKAKKLGVRLTLSRKRPRPMKELGLHPTLAPDGRTDIKTIDLVRGGRDY